MRTDRSAPCGRPLGSAFTEEEFLEVVRIMDKKRPQNHPEVNDGRGMEFLTEINVDFQNFDEAGGKTPGSHLIGQRFIPIVHLPHPLFDLRKI
jgi:hypothetical protein